MPRPTNRFLVPQFDRLLALILLCMLGWVATLPSLRADEPPSPFSKPVIDIGMVVSDLERSVAFYTNLIGFREVSGFQISPELGGKIGLTQHRGTKVRVLTLGDGKAATQLKIMAFPDAGASKPDRHFIHSTLGLNYLTIYVSDMTAPMERLKAAGVKLLGDSPVNLGGGTLLVTIQDPDGSFIELIGPTKGL